MLPLSYCSINSSCLVYRGSDIRRTEHATPETRLPRIGELLSDAAVKSGGFTQGEGTIVSHQRWIVFFLKTREGVPTPRYNVCVFFFGTMMLSVERALSDNTGVRLENS